MSNLDLKELPADLQLTLSKKETDSERRLRLVKDSIVFVLAICVLVLALVWSAWILFEPSATADNKHTAQTVMIAIVSGLVGYLVRK